MQKLGKFITFEGGEGGGKTTQAKLLVAALNHSKIEAIFTREPGGTPEAEEIRNLLVKGKTDKFDKITETLLYFAARRDHVEKMIKPALAEGQWVICDRFTDSTHAYQGYGYGVQHELINGLNRLALGDFKPDLTLIFDIEVERGMERAKKRMEPVSSGDNQKEDRYERMSGDFHKNVRRGFLEIAKNESKRCLVVKAEGTIKGLHKAIIENVNLRLNMHNTLFSLSQQQIDETLSHG